MCFSEPSPAFFWIVLIPFPLSLRQGVRVVQKQIAERAGNIARRQPMQGPGFNLQICKTKLNYPQPKGAGLLSEYFSANLYV